HRRPERHRPRRPAVPAARRGAGADGVVLRPPLSSHAVFCSIRQSSMSATEIENSGTGGGLRYLAEQAAPEMENQELSHSCQAACARQLLNDAGVDIAEADLLAKIGYHEGYGTTAERTAAVLSELHPKWDYDGGSVPEEGLAILFAR